MLGLRNLYLWLLSHVTKVIHLKGTQANSLASFVRKVERMELLKSNCYLLKQTGWRRCSFTCASNMLTLSILRLWHAWWNWTRGWGPSSQWTGSHDSFHLQRHCALETWQTWVWGQKQTRSKSWSISGMMMTMLASKPYKRKRYGHGPISPIASGYTFQSGRHGLLPLASTLSMNRWWWLTPSSLLPIPTGEVESSMSRLVDLRLLISTLMWVPWQLVCHCSMPTWWFSCRSRRISSKPMSSWTASLSGQSPQGSSLATVFTWKLSSVPNQRIRMATAARSSMTSWGHHQEHPAKEEKVNSPLNRTTAGPPTMCTKRGHRHPVKVTHLVPLQLKNTKLIFSQLLNTLVVTALWVLAKTTMLHLIWSRCPMMMKLMIPGVPELRGMRIFSLSAALFLRLVYRPKPILTQPLIAHLLTVCPVVMYIAVHVIFNV